MESIKKQILKKGEQFIIVLEEEDMRKIELVEGDIVQIEKCVVTPITDINPDDLDSYK